MANVTPTLPSRCSVEAASTAGSACRVFLGFLLGGLFILAAPGWGQDFGVPDGRIDGRVVGEDGRPIVGATVHVSSPALIEDRVTHSSATGRFRVPLLRPATYALEVSAEGYVTSILEAQELGLGQRLELFFELRPGSSSSLTASAEPRLDTLTASGDTLVSSEALRRMPENLSLETPVAGSVQLASEIDLCFATELSGSCAVEAKGRPARLLLDGLRVEPLQWMSGAVEHLRVTGAVSEADYRGSCAPLVHVRTQEGGHRLRGVLSLDGTDDDLQASSRRVDPLAPDLERLERASVDASIRHQAAAFSLAGPLSNRARFSLAGVFRDEESRQQAEEKASLDVLDRQALQLLGRATWFLGDANTEPVRLEVAAHRRDADETGFLPPLGGLLLPSGTAAEREDEERGVRLGLAWQLETGWWLEASLGDSESSNRRREALETVRFVTPAIAARVPESLAAPAESQTAGRGGAARLSLERQGWKVVANRSLFGGVSLLRFGLEGERGVERYADSRSLFDLRWAQSSLGEVVGERGSYRYVSSRLEGRLRKTATVGFAELSTSLARRVTATVGARYEEESYRGRELLATGRRDLETEARWVPRLGVVWDALGDGRVKAFASYGHSHRPLASELVLAGLGGFRASVAYYRLDGVDWPLLDPTNPAALQDGSGPPAIEIPLVDPERVDRADSLLVEEERVSTLGTEYLLLPGVWLWGELSYSESSQAPALVRLEGEAGEATWRLATPGKGTAENPYGSALPRHPGLDRRSSILELGARKSVTGRWGGLLAYRYGELEARGQAVDPDLEPVFEAIQPMGSPCGVLEGCFSLDGRASTSPLSGERRHQTRLFLAVRASETFELSAFYRYATGVPVELRLPELLIRTTSGEVLWVAAPRLVAESSGHSPSLSQLDLGARYRWPRQQGATISVFATLVNAFNSQNSVGTWPFVSLEGVAVDRQALFSGGLEAQLEASGLRPDPRGGVGVLPQRPRQAHVGVRIEF